MKRVVVIGVLLLFAVNTLLSAAAVSQHMPYEWRKANTGVSPFYSEVAYFLWGK